MGDNKRQHGRLKTSWSARFEGGAGAWHGVAEDASPGGISLRCGLDTDAPPMGVRGEVALEAGALATAVRTLAEVCWTDRDRETQALRIGLRFLTADRRIVQLLGDALARAHFWSSPPAAAGA